MYVVEGEVVSANIWHRLSLVFILLQSMISNIAGVPVAHILFRNIEQFLSTSGPNLKWATVKYYTTKHYRILLRKAMEDVIIVEYIVLYILIYLQQL